MKDPKDATQALRLARCAEKALTMEEQGYTASLLFDEGVPSVYAVISPEGNRYTTDLPKWTCTCPDFTQNGFCCKHLLYVENAAFDAEQCAEAERQAEDCEVLSTGCDPYARY